MFFVFASVGPTNAQVAELADALDSGSSAGNGVEVRILSWAPHLCSKAAFNSTMELVVYAYSMLG
jgi:hypothetical protein